MLPGQTFEIQLEKKIQELEQRQTELTAELEKKETYDSPGRAVVVNRELVEVQDELAKTTAAWEEAEIKLAAIDAANP